MRYKLATSVLPLTHGTAAMQAVEEKMIRSSGK